MENTDAKYIQNVNDSQRLRRIATEVYALHQELLEVARNYAKVTGREPPITIQEAIILADTVKKDLMRTLNDSK